MGRQAVAALLPRGTDFDAVSCGSDQIARGVCDGLRLEELGRCAARMLLDAVAGNLHPGTKRLAPRLVKGSDVGGLTPAT